MNRIVDYPALTAQALALVEGVPYRVANLANVSALLWQALPQINWAGFYLRQGDSLILGPFQGKPACIRIPLGKGVCGTAAEENRTVRVEDVHSFPGHIACDADSNSEIVIPLRREGQVWAVLDIDSPLRGRFSQADQAGLEQLAGALEKIL